MNGPLGYLIRRTTVNRVMRQLSRLRSPRYAIGMLVGLAYFVFILGRGVGDGTTSAGDMGPDLRLADSLPAFATIAFALVTAYWWLRGAVRGSLAFDPAEVQLLFTAPVSRRTLLGYRIVRTQLVVLVNALLWTFLLRGGGADLAPPLRYLSAWAFFSVPTLHRLGIALMQVEPQGRGRRGLLLAGRAGAVAAVAAIVATAVQLVPATRTLPPAERLRLFGTALETGAAGIMLAPFRWLIAPLTAASPAAWAAAMAVVLVIIALHLAWIYAMPVRFEEAAALASDDRAATRAAVRQRGAGAASPTRVNTARRHWLPLAPTGWPAVAITWKNTLSLLRAGTLRGMAFTIAGAVVMSLILDAVNGGDAPAMALIPPVAVLVMSIAGGPRLLRNDLRQDLLHLELIKTLPLSGFAAVLAEMASPVLLLSGAQVLLLFVAAAMTPATLWAAAAGTGLAPALLVAPVVLVAVNAVNLALQNGAALLFPSWTRLGAGSAGVEAMGQGIVTTVGMVVLLGIALVPPAIEVVVVTALTQPLLGRVALPLALLLGALVLFAEVGWLAGRLGRLLERTEPSALI